MPGLLGGQNQEVVGRVVPAQGAALKQEFSDIFQQDARLKQNTAQAIKKAQEKERPTEEAVTKLNDALSGKNSESAKIEKELEDLNKFSEEDLKLAEELLFNGHAKKDFRLNDRYSATIYSTNALEIAIVNELMFEFTRKYEKPDGRVDVSQKTMDHMHQLYLLAVSFKGYNDKDISTERVRSLDVIKSACKKLSEFEVDGDLASYAKLMEEIKNAVKARAAEIKRLSAAVIDSISYKRYDFERMMYDIVTRGDILPKS
jgi:hypothetical protein